MVPTRATPCAPLRPHVENPIGPESELGNKFGNFCTGYFNFKNHFFFICTLKIKKATSISVKKSFFQFSFCLIIFAYVKWNFKYVTCTDLLKKAWDISEYFFLPWNSVLLYFFAVQNCWGWFYPVWPLRYFGEMWPKRVKTEFTLPIKIYIK